MPDHQQPVKQTRHSVRMPPCPNVQFTMVALVLQGEAEPPQPRRLHAKQQRQLFSGSTIITFQLSTVSPTFSRDGQGALCQPVTDQQIQRAARLPQNIAEEIALFAANLVHNFPQRCRAGRGFDRTARLFRIIAVLGPPAGKRLRVSPSRWSSPASLLLSAYCVRHRRRDQFLRDQGTQFTIVRQQIVLQSLYKRFGSRRRHGGDHIQNHTEIQRVGKGMGISQRRRPLTRIKCSNCA